MDVLNKITQILKNHDCICYEIDKESKTLKYIGEDINCCLLSTAIADLTGYLITNNVEYTMTKDYNIILNTIDEQYK